MLKDALNNLLLDCRYNRAVMLVTRIVKSLLAGVVGIIRLLCITFVMSAALIPRYFMKKETKQYKYPQKQVNQYAVAFEGNVISLTKTSIKTHKYKGKEACSKSS